MAKEIVSGVGARYGVVFVLDTTTGLPLPATAASTPYTGIEVEGIKTLNVNDPAPQRFSHYGNDGVIAQDTLPATEGGSFTIATAKKNLVLDNALEGTKIRTIGNSKFRMANSDQRGNEPLVMFMAYRQALDTTKGSATYGKMRQYEAKVYPAARISPSANSYEQGATDNAYEATPTAVQYTPWNEQVNTTNWGVSRGEYIENTVDHQPRWNFYRGNGTLVAFSLSHTPVSSDYLNVWVDGTLTSPSAVNTSATNPAFTLTSATGTNDKLIAAQIQTATPSQA